MNNPLVSIIILNWNGIKWLEECIDSVMQTSYQPIEIVVVDNASTDNSIDVVYTKYREVVVVKNPENFGYAKGNNIGFKHVKGKYVVMLNNDMVVDKHWLEEPIKYLEKDPQIGIAGCRQMKYFDRTEIDGLYHYMMKSLIFLPIGLNSCYDENNPLFSKPGYVFSVSGGSAIYRKTAFEKIGGFEERFFAYHEDTDLAMRFLFNGWKCVYAPTSVVYHRGSASFKTESPTFVYYFERNRIWFIYKNWPLSVMLRFFPWMIWDEIIHGWDRLIKRNNFRVYLRAKIDALKGLPKFTFQRKEAIQRYREQRKYFHKLYKAIKMPLADDGKE
jgi:GT2 family glycosyltransferase